MYVSQRVLLVQTQTSVLITTIRQYDRIIVFSEHFEGDVLTDLHISSERDSDIVGNLRKIVLYRFHFRMIWSYSASH